MCNFLPECLTYLLGQITVIRERTHNSILMTGFCFVGFLRRRDVIIIILKFLMFTFRRHGLLFVVDVVVVFIGVDVLFVVASFYWFSYMEMDFFRFNFVTSGSKFLFYYDFLISVKIKEKHYSISKLNDTRIKILLLFLSEILCVCRYQSNYCLSKNGIVYFLYITIIWSVYRRIRLVISTYFI